MQVISILFGKLKVYLKKKENKSCFLSFFDIPVSVLRLLLANFLSRDKHSKMGRIWVRGLGTPGLHTWLSNLFLHFEE